MTDATHAVFHVIIRLFSNGIFYSFTSYATLEVIKSMVTRVLLKEFQDISPKM